MAQDSGATVYAAALGFGDVAMTLPTADGSSDQVLKTNGSGTLSWGSAATSMNGLSDALVEDTGSMYVGNDPSSTTDAADYNVALGTTALSAVTTGDNNTAIGHNALTVNEGGNRNTAVGKNALKSNTSGITNVALGSSALERNTTANSNTAVGHASSYLLNSGQNNVSLGYESSKNATSANQNVIIGSESSVWPHAVIRGDDGKIAIGARSSIQDNAVIHCIPQVVTTVGDDVTLGHLCHLEGCRIEDQALVGVGAVVLHNAVVGRGSIVGANAVVRNGQEVPPLSMALGVPAQVREGVVAEGANMLNALSYTARGPNYIKNLRRID